MAILKIMFEICFFFKSWTEQWIVAVIIIIREIQTTMIAQKTISKQVNYYSHLQYHHQKEAKSHDSSQCWYNGLC